MFNMSHWPTYVYINPGTFNRFLINGYAEYFDENILTKDLEYNRFYLCSFKIVGKIR